uniref:Uncharacterized protein n=1 Tax=Anguilla anguilla TaxID=7936 RepID=A0A0E9R2H1_ANGAN
MVRRRREQDVCLAAQDLMGVITRWKSHAHAKWRWEPIG